MSYPLTFNGIPSDYSNNIGGVRVLYIAPAGQICPIVVENGVITSVAAGEAAFKTFAFKSNTASISISQATESGSGIDYYVSEIKTQFIKLGRDKTRELTALSGNDLAVIALDRNGNYWFFGYDRPVNCKALSGQTGTASADYNGYSLTFEDYSLQFPYQVDPKVIHELIDAYIPHEIVISGRVTDRLTGSGIADAIVEFNEGLSIPDLETDTEGYFLYRWNVSCNEYKHLIESKILIIVYGPEHYNSDGYFPILDWSEALNNGYYFEFEIVSRLEVNVSPSLISFEPEGGVAQVSITSPVQIEHYSTEATWLSLGLKSSDSNHIITITAAGNSVDGERSAYVYIRTANIGFTVKVSQSAAVAYLEVIPTTLSFSSEGQ